MRNTGVAYLFWCACFFGFCGVQRFYTGKYVSGVLYFLTFGGFGIGQILDLAFIPGMVEEKNLKYRLLNGVPTDSNHHSVVINLGEKVAPSASNTKAAKEKSDIQIILQLAKDNGGYVSVADCVIATGKPVKEVKNTIATLCTEGLLEMGNHHETGAIIYRIT